MNETRVIIEQTHSEWVERHETEKTEWVGTCSVADCMCLYPSLTMWSCLTAWTDTVWRLLFAVEMHAGRKCFFFFLKALDIFCPLFVSGFAANGAVNDLALITRRASHQPFGSVSCTCSSSMYLLSVMLLSWYLFAFLLCPSPSVACCSDSMVLFPLLAPI